MDIHSSVEEIISKDADFQATLIDLSDEDKEMALNEKRTEVLKQEVASLQEKADKDAELAKNYKIRAEKAEAEAKKPKEDDTSKKSDKSEYTLQDIRALSDVHDDDVQEVVDFAKFKGISITEAKKNTTVQTLLKIKAEERTTAQATNTAVSRKGASKVSGEDLLNKFKQGDIPEKDEDLAKVIEARWSPKKEA